MSYVTVEQRVVVQFLRVDGGPVDVQVTRTDSGLLLKLSEADFIIPAEVVEALYDVWQEVPIGRGHGLLRPSAPQPAFPEVR